MATTEFSFNNFQYLKEYIDKQLRDHERQIRSNLVTDNITSTNPDFPVNIYTDLLVNGDINATGAIIVDEFQSVSKDPNIFINFEYTTPGEIKTGIVSVYNPTALNDTLTELNSNLTITTTGSGTFSQGDLIQITDTNDNNNIYEVDTHIGNLLTIRGIGGNPTVESFTKKSLTSEIINGVITKVNISHLSTGTNGAWEYASGSTTGFVYSTVGSNTSLQDAYNNGQTITINSATLKIYDSFPPYNNSLFKITDNGEVVTYFAVNSSGIETIGVNTGQGYNQVYPMNQPVRSIDNVTFNTINTGQGFTHLYLMDQNIRTTDDVVFNTVNAGNGPTEIYLMDQNIRTTDDVSFNTVNVGHGPTEIYLMDQNIQTTDDVIFNTVNTGQGATNIYLMDQNVRSIDHVTFETINTGQGATDVYLMDQNIRTIDSPTFNTINTGQGYNKLYPMNQPLQTTDSVQFANINTGQGITQVFLMDQNIRTIDDVTFATVNTGHGFNELYAMNQPVRTTDNVTFNTVNTGQGATEIHLMNQNLQTTDDVIFNTVNTGNGPVELYPMDQNLSSNQSPTFAGLTLTNVLNDNTQNKILVIDSITDVIEYRDASSLPSGNPFNQTLNTTSDVTFNTINTGQGVTEIYLMDQNIRTTDDVIFNKLSLSNITNDNTQTKLLVINSISNDVEYRTVNSLPNQFDQLLNTTNDVTFNTINTGQGATEIYLMNQNLQTTDDVTFNTVNTGNGPVELYPMDQNLSSNQSPTFAGLTLTNVLNDNTQNKILVIDSITNVIEYRDVSSLPVNNPFNQTLNTTSDVTFNTVNTGNGPVELYPMDQNLSSNQSPTFAGITLTNVLNDNTQNKILVIDSITDVIEYRDVSSLPVNNPFNQTLNTTSDVTFNTVNTGQGPHELYAMNQDVMTTNSPSFITLNLSAVPNDNTQNKILVLDSITNYVKYRDVNSLPAINPFNQTLNTTNNVIFNTVDTGQGQNELYPMNQAVQTTDSVTFTGITLTNILNDNTQNKLLVLDSITNVIEYRDATSLPAANPFNQILNTTNDVIFNTIDTGQGATEIYLMNQNIRSVDDVTFNTITITNTLNDNLQNKLLVIDNITNTVKYRSVASLPVVNPFNQLLNTTSDVVFNTVDTGQGQNELYPMNQPVRTTDSVTFTGVTLTNILNDNTQNKLLVLDSITNTVEYRDVSSLPVVNPFNQTLNTTSDVVFNTVDTGQGQNELYPMNQPVRTTDGVTFTGLTLTNILNDNTQNKLLVLDSITNTVEYRDVSSLPVVNPFNQLLNTTNDVVFNTVDTGQGQNKLYPMNQPVRTTDNVTFTTVDTGQGANELYAMDQPVRSIDSPTFTTLNLSNVINDNTQNKLLVLDSITNIVEYRNVSSLPVVNPFDQLLNTTNNVTFASVDTGQGATEIYLMDQNIQTTDTPSFIGLNLTGIINDNTQTKILVLDSITDAVEYRDVSSLPSGNPFNQTLNTTDPVVFSTVDTGQGANELYPMNQAVRTTDPVTFTGATLTNILNDNAQNKLLVLDSVTNVVEYRDVSSLPAVNPFDQLLNTTNNVVFNTVDTGQGANELYPMNQPVQTINSVTFAGATLTNVLNDNTQNKLLVLDSITNVVEYRDVSSLPVVNPFDQSLNTTNNVIFNTVDTGQGATDIYLMNQNIRTTDSVVFNTVNTGQGANELYPMDQPVRTTDAVTFTGATLTNILNDNTQTKILVLDSITNVIEYRDVASLPGGNPFDQTLNTTNDVVFNTVDTGQGQNELYPMNQAVRTTDAVTFTGATLTNILNDNTQNKILVLDSITNVIEYRDVASLPGGNPFDQTLNTTNDVVFNTVDTGQGQNELYPMDQAVRTTDAVTFISVDTGQGANELYPMDQPVRTTDQVTFTGAILTNILNDNTQNKLLVLDSVTNVIEYRDVSSLPVVNPFDQLLNTTNNVIFASVDTGQGATEIYLMNQNVRTTDSVVFATVDTGQGANELYPMNQPVRSTDSPIFGTLSLTSVLNDNTQNKILVLDSITNIIEYRDVSSLPNNNPFNQTLNTTSDVVFNTVDTGQGQNELYPMDQAVRTTDAVTFTGATLTNILNDNTQNKLLVLDSITNVIEYRDVSSLPAANPFDQLLNTTNNVTFASVDTGQGATEIYLMNQNIRTTDNPTFGSLILTSVNNDNTQTKILVLDSITNVIEYRDATSLPSGNPFDQLLNTTNNVVFATVDTGQGPTEIYLMNQNIRTTDNVTFNGLILSGVLNDNTETRLLVLDTATNTIEYRDISSLPNPFNQILNTTSDVTFNTINTGQGNNELYAMDQNVRTTDAVTFTSVDTGQGANELYPMDQPVRTTDQVTFTGATLTNILNDNTQNKLLVLDSITNVIEYRDVSSLPVVNPFDQLLNTTNNVVFGSVDTGQGQNELYPMDQPVRTTDAVTFISVDTGQGQNELYPMNQAVRTTDAVTFTGVTLTNILNDNTQTKILVLDSITNVIEYRDVASLPGGNPFDQTLNTTNDVVFNTVDTGQGQNELYPMNQAVRTTDAVTFTGATLTNILNDNTQTKILVLDSITNVIEYRDVASLPGGNPFDQTLNTTNDVVFNTVDTGQGQNELYPMNQAVRTTDAVTFTSVDTGQGANELYPMDQPVRTTDQVTFTGATLTNILNDNTQNKLLVLDSVTNVIEYRDVSSLPVVNPFDQLLNTTNNVIFASVDTGQGATEIYLMNQNVRTSDVPTFVSLSLTGVSNNNTQNKLLVLNSITNVTEYRDVSSLPNQFDQLLNTTNDVVFNTVDTGQGANELYAMDQPVRTTDNVVFASVDTGQGATEIYAMNQPVRTTDAVTFTGATLTNILNDNTQTKILVLDSITNVIEYRDVTSLPNQFDQSLNTTDNVAFASVDTGQGATEIYAMDQPVRTTDAVTFTGATLTNILNDNTQTKILVLDSITNVIEYRDVTSLPNQFDQSLNTTDNVAFASVDTGQGATEIYAMNQPVRTTDAVTFLTVNTGQGDNELYAMDQPVRTTDNVTFNDVSLSGFLSISSLINDSLFEHINLTVGGDKNFTFNSDTNSGAVILSIQNDNSASIAHSQLKISTDVAAALGNGGNQSIYFETSGAGGWTIGQQNSTDTFRFNYNATNTDNLTNDTNTKISIDVNGNVVLGGALSCTTINTGIGATDVYLMDQNIRTTDSPTFTGLTLTNVIVNNTQTKLLTVNSVTDVIEYRDVSSLPSPFDQSLNTTNDVVFNTVNTGQGANELYAMDQNVRTTDPVSFTSVNTGQGNNLLYAMDQPVRSVDAVSFTSVNTGQGNNLLYAMDQPVRSVDDVTFNSLILTNVANDNTETRVLVLDIATNIIQYRDASTLGGGGSPNPPLYGQHRSFTVSTVTISATNTWFAITMGNTYGTGTFSGFTGSAAGVLTKNATIGTLNVLYKFSIMIAYEGTSGSTRSYDFGIFKNGVFLDDVHTLVGVKTSNSSTTYVVTMTGVFMVTPVNNDTYDVRVRCLNGSTNIVINNISFAIYQ